jgi:hypothetical protein
MNKLLASLVLAGIATTGATAQILVQRATGDLTTIGGWDFNGYSTITSVASVNARYNQQYTGYYTGGTAASPGSAAYQATLYFNNTAYGTTFGANAGRASSNAPSYDLLSTVGLGSGNNSLGDISTNPGSISFGNNVAAVYSGRAVFRVQTITTENLFEDVKIDYSVRNGGMTDALIDWSYSLDGGLSFTSVGSTVTVGASGTAYSVQSLDLSAFDVIEGKTDLLIGFSVTDTATSQLFLDNVAIYATAAAIPEPSTYGAIAGLGLLGFAAMRRRTRSV